MLGSLASPAVRKVVSVLFWTFFGASSLVCFVIAAAIFVVTFPFDRNGRTNHMFSCAWASLYALAYPGWDVSMLHRDRIDRQKTYVLVANHTSLADIVLLFGLFRQFKWVSKRTVFKAPLIGWNMWLSRYIPLVRGNPQSIAEMMASCRRWLARGISIMMFPEGTRSEDGTLRPFKHGAFTLALDGSVAVVPIAIHGGHTLIPKHEKTFATKAKLVVEVLDPISPAAFSDPEAFATAAREAIQHALDARAGKAIEPASELLPSAGALADAQRERATTH